MSRATPVLAPDQACPPKIVSETLGHASMTITLNTYSHMLPEMGGEVADAIREALG